MIEVFVDIKGFEGLYQISNLGRVKAMKKKIRNRWGNGSVLNELIMVSTKTKTGYLALNLFREGRMKHFRVHRLVASAFIPNPENKPEVNHINGIKSDNRVDNLEWSTTSENELHAYKIGIKKPMMGETNPAAILTEDQVLEIRTKYANTRTPMRRLAKEYGVCASTISGIVTNKFWKNIKAA